MVVRARARARVHIDSCDRTTERKERDFYRTVQ